MANTGYSWSAWSFVQESASDWNADALADNGTDTSDAIDLDGKAAVSFGFLFTEDNTGAIDGVVTIVIGREVHSTPYFEDIAQSTGLFYVVTPIQNATVPFVITLSADQTGPGCKIYVKNEGGQELAVTVYMSTATVPVAS